MDRTAGLPLGRLWGVRAFANPGFVTAILVVVACLSAAALVAYALVPPPLLDFETHLRGGARWLKGQDPYYSVPPGSERFAPVSVGFAYPPYVLPLFAALSRLGFNWASGLWLAAGFCALGWWIWEFARPRTMRRLACLVILAVSFYPTIANVGLGQVGLFTLAGTWAALRLSRQPIAGLSLAAGSVFKLFPLAVGIVLAVYGRWRVALIAATALAGSIAATWPWVNGLWPEYSKDILLHKAMVVATSPANQSLTAAIHRTFTVNPYQYQLVVAPGLARALSLLVALALALLAVVVAWALKSCDAGLGYAMTLATLPLALTNAWQHYYILALPLLWMVAAEGVRRRDVWLLIGAVLTEGAVSIAAATVDHWYFLIAHAAPSVHGIYANASALGGVVLLLAGLRLAILTKREGRLSASRR